jgi:hypothetical protein
MPKMIAMAVLSAGGKLDRVERDIPAPGRG